MIAGLKAATRTGSEKMMKRHLTHYPNFDGSNPATATDTGGEKMVLRGLLIMASGCSIIGRIQGLNPDNLTLNPATGTGIEKNGKMFDSHCLWH
jgi:hypothetical protein